MKPDFNQQVSQFVCFQRNTFPLCVFVAVFSSCHPEQQIQDAPLRRQTVDSLRTMATDCVQKLVILWQLILRMSQHFEHRGLRSALYTAAAALKVA